MDPNTRRRYLGKPLLGTLFLLLPVLAAVAGERAVAPPNLLANPDFDATLSPWQTTGTINWDSAGGLSTPGSAHCTDSSCQLSSQCVDLSALAHPVSLDTEISYTHGGATETLAKSVSLYPNSTCSGFGQTVGFTEYFFPPNGWTNYEETVQTNPDTQSVRVFFGASSGLGGGSLDSRFDDAKLTEFVDPSIFMDDFESGNTSKWAP